MSCVSKSLLSNIKTTVKFIYIFRNTPDWPDYFNLSLKSSTIVKHKNSLKSTQNGNNNSSKHNTPVKYDAEETKLWIEQANETNVLDPHTSSPYPTSFCNQFVSLFHRNFTNARRRILFPISIIQNMYILVVCILVWWQPDRTEDTVKDRLGLVCNRLRRRKF
jgi:hypothetical protein